MSNLQEEIKKISHDILPKRSERECLTLATDLLNKMTLAEKIGQLYQYAPTNAAVEGLKAEDGDTQKLITSGMVGSILSVAGGLAIYQLQKIAVEQSRLKIPLFFGYDIIHGCKTGFPINLAMACTFDPELIEETCQMIAYETSKMGITMTYSPMVDLVRDPRWGRVMESNGEDPYLNTLLAKAYVNGFQQNDLSSYDSVAACCKHFAAYGAVEGGREYNTVDMSNRELHQNYLSGYKACAEAGVAAFMTSFNVVDGVPATANKYLLRDILRDRWNYSGVVISDYTSSFEMLDHKTSKNEQNVALQSILAGLDHEMVATTYIKHLEELVDKGEVPQKLIDEACLRILLLKYQAGLFDNPYKNIYADEESYQLQNPARDLARKVAAKSMVLLKNTNQTLPLYSGLKIAVVGPQAISNQMVGAWGGLVKDESCISLVDGLKIQYGEENISYALGCNINDNDYSQIEEALEIAAQADIVILALGEDQQMSGEAKSRAYLTIPGLQNELASRIKLLNKPIVSIIFAGRPLELNWYNENSDAVIMAWFLGSESGNALADIISGKVNPSAKLAMSFPYTVGQVPVYYNQYKTGRPSPTGQYAEFRSCYIDAPNYPLYPFGYGLSYSTFEFANLSLSANIISGEQELTVSVDISNKSKVCGEATVQLYIECLSFSVVRPVRELKKIKKLALGASEMAQIKFNLNRADLAYYNINMEFTPESTTYRIYVGDNSLATLAAEFEYIC